MSLHLVACREEEHVCLAHGFYGYVILFGGGSPAQPCFRGVNYLEVGT